MAKANDLERGSCVEINNEPFQVIEREFVKPGKGGAFVRLKLKSCLNGAIRKETYASEVHIPSAEITKRAIQFLYLEGAAYHCMDSENFEQFTVPSESIGSKGNLLQEGKEYTLLQWNDRCIDIEIPLKVAYPVLEAGDAVRGNTVSGATKTITIQNNVHVKVPLFIKNGDTILINTESGEYVERVTH